MEFELGNEFEVGKKYIFDKECYRNACDGCEDCELDADCFIWCEDVIGEVFYIEHESQINHCGDIYSEEGYIIDPNWCVEVK